MEEKRTSLEVIAPSVGEAIARGAAELGLPEDSLDVVVLDEGSRGILGLGGRQARVRLTIRERAQASLGPLEAPMAPSEIPLSEEEEEALQACRDIVVELLKRMSIEARVTARWEPQPEPGQTRPLWVDISGSDLSLLIGRRGETLSALQYLTRLIVSKELRRQIAVIIDIEGYRGRRERQLRQLARRIAEQAVERDRTMVLEPMPANERRIIHLELRDHPRVITESTGEGERRKVTIIPRN